MKDKLDFYVRVPPKGRPPHDMKPRWEIKAEGVTIDFCKKERPKWEAAGWQVLTLAHGEEPPAIVD